MQIVSTVYHTPLSVLFSPLKSSERVMMTFVIPLSRNWKTYQAGFASWDHPKILHSIAFSFRNPYIYSTYRFSTKEKQMIDIIFVRWQTKVIHFLDESLQSLSVNKIGWFDVIKSFTPCSCVFLCVITLWWKCTASLGPYMLDPSILFNPSISVARLQSLMSVCRRDESRELQSLLSAIAVTADI